jgi:oxygen-independent coproporphyrinogen-3 oxidase
MSQLTEFTVEANPETLTPELLETLVAGGVNRLSIGAQSFNTAQLKTLERWHDPTNVPRAVELAHAAGIENVNLDFIYAIPGQSLEHWRDDLQEALALKPTHLSCYALVFEPNTPLTKKRDMGRITQADNDLEAAMFRATVDTLREAGFEHYEISNFALPDRRCRHNVLYWLNENYLALGPGAAGHVDGLRYKNMPHLGRYIDSTGLAPLAEHETLGDEDSIGEQIMLRLRLIDGIDLAWLEPRLNASRRAAIEEHTREGLLERTPDHLKLTERGLLLADNVIADLL